MPALHRDGSKPTDQGDTVTRSVMRFVPHTIRHAPEGGVTFEAFCVVFGCDQESSAQEE